MKKKFIKCKVYLCIYIVYAHTNRLKSRNESTVTKITAKTVGVRWKSTSDEFFFVPPDLATEISPTKRQVISQIAKLFDTAGWLFMEEIWLQDNSVKNRGLS